jgi:NAD(P)-dependent dehydrogenase (short-subunit alcohol dehydrogenase family)
VIAWFSTAGGPKALAVSEVRNGIRAALVPMVAPKQIVAGSGGFATGRFTTPQEVAPLVVLLASEVTANVTGANYIIDGGLIKTT